MAGYDQKSNVVLSDSKERVYSMEEGVEEVPLGLYLVKGDMMCVYAVFIFVSHRNNDDFWVASSLAKSMKLSTRPLISQRYVQNRYHPYDTKRSICTITHHSASSLSLLVGTSERYIWTDVLASFHTAGFCKLEGHSICVPYPRHMVPFSL